MDDTLEEAINSIAARGTICFLGAGFSIDGRDAYGQNLPTSNELAAEICAVIGIPADSNQSLSSLAEYCQTDPLLAPKLNELLLKRLTVCDPSPSQKLLLGAPWRSIFTTNFDDLVERALPSEQCQIIGPTIDVHRVNPSKLPIYYLHGRILDLTEAATSPNLVLAESNYLGLHQRNKNLYSMLLNEVHCARKIFFIGWSAQDLKIAEALLAASEHIRHKSVVICGPNEDIITVKNLEKYGAVYPIGLSGLTDLFPTDFSAKDMEENLSFVKKVERSNAANQIESDDLDHLILTGEFDLSKYRKQKSSDGDDRRYCIERSKNLEEIFKTSSEHIQRFLVTADIGNGKTTFLEQVAYSGLERGYDVFIADNKLQETFDELELLLKKPSRQIFIVDDIVRNKALASFIGKRLPDLSMLICSSRGEFDGGQFENVSNILGGATKEVDINELTDQELIQWDSLLENWGYWEDKIALPDEGRLHFLKQDCGAENRSVILSIFRSSSVSKKIDSLVNLFINSKPQHLNSFIAILISSLCQNHVEWSNIVQWLGIDESGFKKDILDSDVLDFMSDRRQWHRFTSTQLASYIFRSYSFDEEVIVRIYTEIVKNTAQSANDPRSGDEFKENMKELLKYRFLTGLFGDDASALLSIEAVYRKLRDVPRIRQNDQFWLQFSMSKLAINNLEDAEKYINTALGIAKGYGLDYSPHQILDQRVRLYLQKNSQKKGVFNTIELNQALADLTDSLHHKDSDLIYPMRSATYLDTLIDMQVEEFDERLKQKMLSTLEEMRSEIRDISRLPRSRRGETKKIKDAVNNAIMNLKYS